MLWIKFDWAWHHPCWQLIFVIYTSVCLFLESAQCTIVLIGSLWSLDFSYVRFAFRFWGSQPFNNRVATQFRIQERLRSFVFKQLKSLLVAFFFMDWNDTDILHYDTFLVSNETQTKRILSSGVVVSFVSSFFSHEHFLFVITTRRLVPSTSAMNTGLKKEQQHLCLGPHRWVARTSQVQE